MTATDIPALLFVDPTQVDRRWRIGLFAAPGGGKTVAACSAPGPILAVNADRPGAYRYARRLHAGQQINEVRFQSWQTMGEVYRYARENQSEIGTVVFDPANVIYQALVKENTGQSGKPNWQVVNEKFLDLIKAFRDLDVNLVLVAHERTEKDENADTEAKVYPNYGGPALIQQVMGELDIVARMFRRDASDEAPEAYMGQLVTARGYQCKDSSGVLGRTRVADLSEWIAVANAEDTTDLPWGDDVDPETEDEAGELVAPEVPS